jgi:peptidoglycan/LPS O-acetylase OafA/YrhL
MQYRPEIDGLRALAVIPVILFHAGIQLFGGGYVGVDIFFVISGYLITSILLSEMVDRKFTLTGFYERRARRILPALFLVMAIFLPFAWFWMPPHELKGFSQSLVAVSTFASNIYFWISTGYFETAAELRPLLHTWSLAVEEQFYLLFPVLLAWGMPLGRKKIIFIFAFLGCASLFLAQLLSEIRPAFDFYLLPTRVWELLAGSILAFYSQLSGDQKNQRIFREIGSLIGLLLIFYAIFGFDKFTPFPSLYTLIPVLGALLIIYTSQKTIVGKLLSKRIFVGIGLISYSLYLWHQPVFAFARVKAGHEPDQVVLALLVLIISVLSYLSWKFVEIPFRDKRRFSQNKIFLFSVFGSLLFISIGLIGQFTSGFLTKSQKAVLAYNEYQEESKKIGRVGSCFLDVGDSIDLFNASCIEDNSDDSIFIWGDSHAAALSFGLRHIYKNVTQFTSTGCPPLMDEFVASRPLCRDINNYIGSQIKNLKPKNIFLYANWGIYDAQHPLESLNKTVDFIRLVSPSSKITILGGTPQFLPSLPTYMFLNHKNLKLGEVMPTYLYDHLTLMDQKWAALAKQKKIDFFSTLKVFCQANVCKVTAEYDGVIMPIIWDYGHLTAAGSVLLANKIKLQKQQ